MGFDNRIIKNIIIVATIILGVYIFVTKLFIYFIPFVIGYIIALCIEPLIIILHRKLKLSRNISSLLSLVGFISIIGYFGNILINKLVNEVQQLIQNWPEYQVQLINSLIELSSKIDVLINKADGSTFEAIENNWKAIGLRFTNSIQSEVTSGSISIVSAVPSFLFTVIITIIVAYFISKDKNAIKVFIAKQIPLKWKEKMTLVKNALLRAFYGYIRAQLILMGIIGIICIVGLAIMGNPYALLIGLIISLLDAIPMFGSGTVLIPWALFSIFTGDLQLAIYLGILYAVCVLTRQFLEPKLISDNIGLHPLVTIFSLYVGFKVFGIIGFFIGPLIAIFIKTMQEMQIIPRWKT